MQRNLTEQLLKGIVEILFEFRTGNTDFRIPRTNHEHFPDEAIDLVNLVAEKLQAKIELTDPEFVQYYARVVTVTTDFDFTIIDYSRNFEEVVVEFDDLIGTCLSEFVERVWDLRVIGNKIKSGRNECVLLPVNFYREDHIITACATMTGQKEGERFMNIITIHENRTVETVPVRVKWVEGCWDSDLEEAQRLIRQYVESNEGGDYSTAALTEKLHIPPHRIKRVFSAFYGRYFSDFVRETRLIRAFNKIVHTNEDISTIALTEFKSYRSFHNAFVKFFGVIPDKMRHDKL